MFPRQAINFRAGTILAACTCRAEDWCSDLYYLRSSDELLDGADNDLKDIKRVLKTYRHAAISCWPLYTTAHLLLNSPEVVCRTFSAWS